MLQNAAKPGKLMEKHGNFGMIDLAQSGKFCLKSGPKRIFIAKEECCKNNLMTGRGTAGHDFPAEGPDHSSFYPPGGISCI
jgi:hypothetical protein